MLLRTFSYRLRPTKKQVALLNRQLSLCQRLYNKLLEQRIQVYEDDRRTLSMFDQCKFITLIKRKDWPELKEVNAQALQNVATRLDLAFKSFFRRVKAGDTPGYPRFKLRDRYSSITFPQFPCGCSIKEGKLVVGKVGHIKMKLHRPVAGKVKIATLKRSPTGKWFVTFSCEGVVKAKQSPMESEIAIDLGLRSFAFLSNGERIENPRFYRTEERSLTRANRRFNNTQGAMRKGARKVLSRVHERIRNKRRDFCLKTANTIVARFSTIFIEDLTVNRMVHNHCLAKSIHDAGWATFTRWLTIKAEEAGSRVVKVNPAYTSQDCSSCGHRERKTLDEREHKCECCGFKCDRDLNASLNILRLGKQSDLARGKSLCL